MMYARPRVAPLPRQLRWMMFSAHPQSPFGMRVLPRASRGVSGEAVDGVGEPLAFRARQHRILMIFKGF